MSALAWFRHSRVCAQPLGYEPEEPMLFDNFYIIFLLR
jgi:hypothetical protein